MKITKEQFDNLSQLDRIEYRQRLEGIESEAGYKGIFFYFLFGTLLILPTTILFDILIDSPLVFTGLAIKFGSWLMVFGFLVDIVYLIKRTKRVNRLNEEYFGEKIEINIGFDTPKIEYYNPIKKRGKNGHRHK